MTPDVCHLGHRCVFSFFFFVFLKLRNVLFVVFTGYDLYNTQQDSGGDEKEPKRCGTRVVWAVVVFTFPFSSFFKPTNVLLLATVVETARKDRRG